MAASATCSSCGLRHPATAYPVSINNATKRAMGTCLSCLQEHVILSEWENAGIRQPTAEENAATIAALNTKKSTKHVTRAVHRRTLKRKRDQVIAASKRASLALADTKKTCRICVEEKELTAFPSSLKRATKRSSSSVEIPPRCQDHLGVKSKDGPVCKSCIAGALTAAIELKGAERTGCFECNAAWDIAFIARYVTAEVSTAYLDMLLKVTLARNSEFIWCINPKCGSGGFAERKREGTGYPQVECGQCKERSCANCKVKWHAGKTCQQFQLTRTDEMTEQEKQALRKLEQVDARRCPKCQMAVEKNGGCPSMYCESFTS